MHIEEVFDHRLSFTETSAPLSISNFIIDVLPLFAAKISAVAPFKIFGVHICVLFN